MTQSGVLSAEKAENILDKLDWFLRHYETMTDDASKGFLPSAGDPGAGDSADLASLFQFEAKLDSIAGWVQSIDQRFCDLVALIDRPGDLLPHANMAANPDSAATAAVSRPGGDGRTQALGPCA